MFYFFSASWNWPLWHIVSSEDWFPRHDWRWCGQDSVHSFEASNICLLSASTQLCQAALVLLAGVWNDSLCYDCWWWCRPNTLGQCSPASTNLIKWWKVLGALHNPNGLTRNWFKLNRVTHNPNGLTRKLIQAEWGDEGCLLMISWLHLHFPVATCKVNDWKPLWPWQGIQCVINMWVRVGILFCETVDSAIVYTKAWCTTFLHHQYNGWCPWPTCWFDNLLL